MDLKGAQDKKNPKTRMNDLIANFLPHNVPSRVGDAVVHFRCSLEAAADSSSDLVFQRDFLLLDNAAKCASVNSEIKAMMMGCLRGNLRLSEDNPEAALDAVLPTCYGHIMQRSGRQSEKF